MESYGDRQVFREPFLEKLAKRPLLLIVITASLSFGIQLIPFKMVLNSLLKSLKAFSQELFLEKSNHLLLAPPILLSFVCLAIFFIVYTSEQEKREAKFEDPNHSVLEPSRGLIYRTATLGQSIITHFFSHAEDEHILVSGGASSASDHNIPLHKQENTDENFIYPTKAEQISVRSSTRGRMNQLANTSNTNKKLTRPATSTVLASKGRSIPEPKLNKLPKSFREDPLEVHKAEVDGRFDAYLRNFRRQLELQKQESPTVKDLERRLKSFNRDLQQSKEPCPVTSNDASSEGGMALSKPEVNMDLTEAELNERIDRFLTGAQNSSIGEMPKTRTPQHRKSHSGSYSVQRFVDGASIQSSAPNSTHPSQIIREDSLAIENQKFEAFLQNFRNELKLQKQKSNLHKQLHHSHEI